MPAVLEITVQPTEADTHFVTTVVLEQAKYRFEFYTNKCDNGWYFDLENEDGSSAVRGIALATGVNLLGPYRHLDFPPGNLFIFDKGLNGSDPDLDAFKEGRAALFYLESE